MSPAPKENPEHLALHARPRRVKRLNRRSLVVIAVVVTCVVLGALLWALRKPQPRKPPESQTAPVAHLSRAAGLDALPRDYASLPKTPRLGAPIGELGRPVLKAEREAGLEAAPESPNFRPNAEDEAFRAERLRVQGESEEARKAQVFYQLRQRHDGSSTVANKADPDRAGSESSPDGVAAAPRQRAIDPNRQDSKQAFVADPADTRLYGSAALQTPRSPFQLMAGTIIPAALWTAINSDLPGQVIAMVTENIFDTVSGKTLLIPQGSRLLGQYDSGVAFGQRRVLLVWTRLLMPDGSSIVLDRVPGADTAGHAGLEDKVDWHWGRIFGGAAVSTLIGVGAELAAPDRGSSSGTVVIATRQSIQDSVNEIGQQITRKNLDLQPTLTIRDGFPVRAIVNRDLILRPYGN